MRVCVFGLRGFPEIQGGVEKHCEALYTNFIHSEVEFIVFRRNPYVKYTPVYKNIRFIDLPSTRIKGLEPVIHSFLATLKSLCLKPDIVHIHNIGPALFCPLLKLFGIKVVVTYHSPNYEHNKWSVFGKKVLRFCEKLVLKYADKVIFVNSFQISKMPERYRSKFVYIPNGIADDLTPSQEFEYIEKLGLKKDKYILALGRITPEKGFDVLIEAFDRAETGDCKLCIAGSVETEKSYFEKLKADSGSNVIFPGFVTGELLRQLYSHARLFVLPSINEGFPLSLLDAMAYKCEILASDISASHLVQLPENNYFAPGNSGQLSVLLTERLKRERIPFNYDITEFNWCSIASKTDCIYKSICG